MKKSGNIMQDVQHLKKIREEYLRYVHYFSDLKERILNVYL